jgi:hypothetical protein
MSGDDVWQHCFEDNPNQAHTPQTSLR